MSLETLAAAIPGYADDLRANLLCLRSDNRLSETQFWGTVVVSAMVCRSRQLLEELLAEAAASIPPQTMVAAQSAAALMGMNNVYFRFGHLSCHPAYRQMPSRLRMNAARRHGASPLDFELWCLAASAIQGCQACIDRHEQALRKNGVAEEVILAAVRIAAILHGVAIVMDTESFRKPV